MKIGIMLGDNTKYGSKTNLENFVLYDKFSVDLIARFPNNCNIELQVVQRTAIRALHTKINNNGFDFVIALDCSSKHAPSLNPQILYLRDSLKTHKIAQNFAQSMKRVPEFRNVTAQFRNVSDIEGYPFSHIEVPCIIAKPFQGDNLQETLNNYQSLISVYIQAIQSSVKLLQ